MSKVNKNWVNFEKTINIRHHLQFFEVISPILLTQSCSLFPPKDFCSFSSMKMEELSVISFDFCFASILSRDRLRLVEMGSQFAHSNTISESFQSEIVIEPFVRFRISTKIVYPKQNKPTSKCALPKHQVN